MKREILTSLCALLACQAVLGFDISIEPLEDKDIRANIHRPNGFRLVTDGNVDVSDIKWLFCLPMKDNGDYHILAAADNSAEFTVAPSGFLSPLADSYVTDSHGVAVARVNVTAKVDGQLLGAEYFYPVGLAPYLSEPAITKIKEESPGYYAVTFEVDFAGLDSNHKYIGVGVDYEFSSVVQIQMIEVAESPFRHTEKILDSYHCWIDISASNRFGETTVTLDCPPGFAGPGSETVADVAPDRVEAWTIDGRHVGSFATSDEAVLNLAAGIYIVEIYDGATVVSRKKVRL